MSHENVEIVRKALAVWIDVDEGLADPQRLAEFYAADATFDLGTYSGWPERSETRGLDAFLEFRAAWMEPYDDWRYDVEKIVDAGVNGVVATFHQRGKLRGSDSWVDMHYGIVYTVEEGLITRARVYANSEQALEAAGLSE
jgi:ketosteroid isomerase-like protein